MEVLVVIALYQPLTRAEIEAIRGVGLSQASMDLLLETGMITSQGRKPVAGSPALWVTTPLFLAQFGLRSIRDIPGFHLALPIPAPAPGGGAGKGESSPEYEADESAEEEEAPRTGSGA